MTQEDITCIIQWFAHIEQLATDRKNANGVVMEDVEHLLNTIKVIAKDSREYVEHFCQPSLPSDLDEAAEEYAKTTFKKPYSDNPDEEVTIVEPDKYAGFIAGAKWDKEQMMKEAVEGEIRGDIRNQEEKPYQIWAESDFLPLGEKFEIGDKVRIIIVKED